VLRHEFRPAKVARELDVQNDQARPVCADVGRGCEGESSAESQSQGKGK
jgi:hypothetical protein